MTFVTTLERPCDGACGVDTKYDLSYNARIVPKLDYRDGRMGIAPVRVWFAVAVVIALVAGVAVWSATSSQLGGPVSALEVEPVPREAAEDPQATRSSTEVRGTPTGKGKAVAAPPVGSVVAPGGAASKAPDSPTDDATPASAMKQAAQERDLRGGLHIGGHSRLMDSFIGVVDVDESDVAKTINVHILIDEDYRYYFDLDSQTVPAGEKVMFVVDNTHFTPDECW